MIKTMFALLLIAGIILAASFDPVAASANGTREHPQPPDWWQKDFGQAPAAHSFADVSSIDHIGSPKVPNEDALLPRLDTLDPLRTSQTRRAKPRVSRALKTQ